MVAAVVVGGCGYAPGAALGPPRVIADVGAVPAASAVAWTQTLAGPVTASLAPDASVVAGDSSTGPWARYASGQALALPTVGTSRAIALAGGRVVLGPGVTDPPSPLALVGAGRVLWSTSAIGPVSATGSLDGSHVVLSDAGAATAVELTLSAGEPPVPVAVPALSKLSAGAALQYDDLGDLLVSNPPAVSLYGPAGGLQWSVTLPGNLPPRAFVLDRAGDGGVTAATSGSDHALYQMQAASGHAKVAWSLPLPADGANLPVAGPDGLVTVWGLGGPSALAVYRTADGTRLWQDSLGPQDGTAPALAAVAFGPGDGVVAALTGCDAAGDPCLLLLDADGEPIARLPLAAGTRALLAQDGLAAVIVPATPVPGPATVSWLDLSGVWNAAAAGSGGSAGSGDAASTSAS